MVWSSRTRRSTGGHFKLIRAKTCLFRLEGTTQHRRNQARPARVLDATPDAQRIDADADVADADDLDRGRFVSGKSKTKGGTRSDG